MGQAKQRGTKDERVGKAKTSTMGDSPITKVYDVIFGLVDMLYTKTGGINHELIGFDLKNGEVAGANTLLITKENINHIPERVGQMLNKFPVVAHICEAWEAPSADVLAVEHPERKDVIAIVIYTESSAFTASCEVNPKNQTVKKGELHETVSLQGRMAHQLPQKH